MNESSVNKKKEKIWDKNEKRKKCTEREKERESNDREI